MIDFLKQNILIADTLSLQEMNFATPGYLKANSEYWEQVFAEEKRLKSQRTKRAEYRKKKQDRIDTISWVI